MGKVFVHKPLKRAELRRLSEEPKPAEACPQPILALQDAKLDPAEKERRLKERLQRRDDDRKVTELAEKFALSCTPVVVNGAAFIRWLVEGLAFERDHEGQSEFVWKTNLVSLAENVTRCLVCGADNPLDPKHSAFVVWPDIFKAEGQSIGSVACPRCCGFQRRFYAHRLVDMVLESLETQELAPGRLAKFELLENDRRLLGWAAEPRRGNDRKAVRKTVDSGAFGAALAGLSEIIREDEARLNRNAVPASWTVKRILP